MLDWFLAGISIAVALLVIVGVIVMALREKARD
jgi:hypothetical protein